MFRVLDLVPQRLVKATHRPAVEQPPASARREIGRASVPVMTAEESHAAHATSTFESVEIIVVPGIGCRIGRHGKIPCHPLATILHRKVGRFREAAVGPSVATNMTIILQHSSRDGNG